MQKILVNSLENYLEDEKIPDIWKVGHISAIHKSSWHSKAENYRLISLTSVPGKIMEILIRDQIVDHMTENNIFSPEQNGFISGKSCTTQLLEFFEDLTEALDNGKDIDVIHLDFQKAFDKVPHKRLLKKNNGLIIWNSRQKPFLDQRLSFR